MTDINSSQAAVVIERTLDAPVALVWRLWTEPEHVKAWYGPRGASVSVAEMDVRVGGRRLVSMAVETPNGSMQLWFTGEYREVIVDERLVYSESMSDEAGNVISPSAMDMPEGHPETTEVIVQLEDLGGRTKMVMTHVGVPADSGGAIGWSTAFDKMAAYLESIGS